MVDIKAIDENIVTVTPALNTRLIQDDQSDLSFEKGRETVIRPRDIRSNFLKKMLIDGVLRVEKGILRFNYKGTEFVFKKTEVSE